MGATLGPALIGEFLEHTVAKNFAQLSAILTDSNPAIQHLPIGDLAGMLGMQALVVSMKEIYGWLLIVALTSLLIIIVSYGPLRPWAIFPKWRTIRRIIRRGVRVQQSSGVI